MTVNVSFPDLPEFRRALAAMVMRVERATGPATRAGAEHIVESIHKHMDGPMPPKPAGFPPARRTGNLFDSIRMRTVGGGVGRGRWNYEIYADTAQAPYARRIEFGFHGTDVLGRKYNQPPYPYFYPGVRDAIADGTIMKTYLEGWGGAIL